MVKLMTRMRYLRTKLRRLRMGPGAATLEPSSNITRLHLTFSKAAHNKGNLAAHRFWRTHLPRVKYFNPGLGITVKQLQKETVPATLSVYFNNSSEGENVHSSTNKASKETETNDVQDEYAPKPTSSEIVKTLNVKSKKSDQTWQQLKQLMAAEDVKPSEADLKEVEEAREFARKMQMTRKRNEAVEQAKRNREEMLNKAVEDVRRLHQR